MAVSLASEPELVIRLAHRHRRHLHQSLGEIDQRRMRFGAEVVIVRQLRHLPYRRIDQPPLRKTDRDAPKPGHRLDIAVAGEVLDIDAVALLDDERPCLLMLAGVGVAMHVIAYVAGFGRIRSCVHDGSCAARRNSSAAGPARQVPVHYAV
ncbi:hypothetical protein X759_22775 [Mesorhizobium sp. LSHC420B00]|nr:hypothetical protein X759_22775 [Mesorhizobium sp. LSHC420B00]